MTIIQNVADMRTELFINPLERETRGVEVALQIREKIHSGAKETSPFSLCEKVVTSSAKRDAKDDSGS